MNRELSSLPCEDEEEYKQEVAQRKHELDGHLEAQRMESTRKKKKVTPKGKTVPTQNHLKIRAAADAERKWEQDLKTVKGLSEGEVGLCVGIVAKYHKSGCFPESDPDENQKYLDLAREGWRLFREGYELMEKYPECLDQTYIDGKCRTDDILSVINPTGITRSWSASTLIELSRDVNTDFVLTPIPTVLATPGGVSVTDTVSVQVERCGDATGSVSVGGTVCLAIYPESTSNLAGYKVDKVVDLTYTAYTGDVSTGITQAATNDDGSLLQLSANADTCTKAGGQCIETLIRAGMIHDGATLYNIRASGSAEVSVGNRRLEEGSVLRSFDIVIPVSWEEAVPQSADMESSATTSIWAFGVVSVSVLLGLLR